MSQPASGRATARDFPPEILRLFDRYVHGDIDRRGFLSAAAAHTAGATAAAAMLAALTPNFAAAQQIAPDHRGLDARRVNWPSPDGHGEAGGYLVLPRDASGPLPLLLVIHENRGLNPHIEDVTRRLALEGFVALAPDALFPVGGYPGDEDQARELFRTVDQNLARADFVAAARWLLAHPQGNGRLGAIGFCYGGAMVNYLATQLPELRAGVPFYGGPAPLQQVAAIEAALLLVFAGEDERVNAAWPPYEAALQAAGKRFEAITYPGTQHGFHNDTTPRYDQPAARAAWARAVAFLGAELRS